jgi:TonB-linked SusC/RagA family outer membrane protein
MRVKKIYTLLVLLVFSVTSALAQEKNVSGTVTDHSGIPLPGVNVLVKGTTTGTQTDFDGNYNISVAVGQTLVFSYVGQKTTERRVGSANTINVQMEEGAQALDEVVVVGYGVTTKQSYTGTAKVVKAEELEKKNVTNVSQALQGEVPGMTVINTSGQPGTVATMRVRGFGSVNGNRAPLYVLDGVPYSGSINSINPADIETATVLKDATATAIYGSRGANGVIVITTKAGRAGVSSIEVDAKTGVNFRGIEDYKVITSPDEYLELSWHAMRNSNTGGLTDVEFANDNLFGPQGISPLYNYYTTNDVSQIIDPTTGNVRQGLTRKYTPENWREFAFQSSVRTEANVKMTGGNEKTRYFASFGYLDDIGYITNSDFKRYSTRLNLTHKPAEWITANSNISYSYDRRTNNGQGSSSNSVFWFANSIPSIYPLFLRDANGNFVPDDRYGGNQYDYGDVNGRSFGLGTNAISDARINLSERDRHNLNANFSVKLDLFEGLTFETKYGLQYFNTVSNSVNNPFYGAISSANGRLTQGRGNTVIQNLLNMFTYKKIFGDHNLDILVAHESNESLAQSNSVTKEGVVNLANGLKSLNNYILQPNPATGLETEGALESYFTRINYGFGGKYYLSGSLRRDGSSRLANKKWGTFGSVGASWVLSEESFMENANFVDFLKLKASYGILGDQAGVGTYSGQNTYTASNLGGQIALAVNAIQDPNLTWETSKIFQVGTEFTLFNNFLDVSVDYYSKDTEDLIFQRRIGPSIGDALITVNDGVLRNSGLEFDVTSYLVDKDNFKLDFSINGAFLKNELITMPIEPSTGLPKILDQSGNYGRAEGRSLFDFYIREWAGVNPDNGRALWNEYYHDANSNGTLDAGESISNLTEYQDANPDNAISKTTTETYTDATEKFINKSAIPTVSGAFKLNAQYQNFSLSAQFGYSLGGYSYDNRYAGLMSNSQAGSSQYSVDIRNSWKAPGDITDVPQLQSGLNPQVNSVSSRFVTSSDYLALNNVRLAYNIPSKFLANSGISNVNVWLSGDNLYLLSARTGFDPRLSQTGANSVYAYSPMTTITLGLRVKI